MKELIVCSSNSNSKAIRGRGTRSIYIIKVHTTCFNVVTSNDSRKDEKNPMCHFRVF